MIDEYLKSGLKELREIRNEAKRGLERAKLAIKTGLPAEIRVEVAHQHERSQKVIEIAEMAIKELKGAPPSNETVIELMIAFETIFALCDMPRSHAVRNGRLAKSA